MNSPSKNYINFLKVNTQKFRGEWVVLFGKKIVAHGKRADTVYNKALKNYPREKISLAKIPSEPVMVLCSVSSIKKN